MAMSMVVILILRLMPHKSPQNPAWRGYTFPGFRAGHAEAGDRFRLRHHFFKEGVMAAARIREEPGVRKGVGIVAAFGCEGAPTWPPGPLGGKMRISTVAVIGTVCLLASACAKKDHSADAAAASSDAAASAQNAANTAADAAAASNTAAQADAAAKQADSAADQAGKMAVDAGNAAKKAGDKAKDASH
jgi:hypothetical protein